jgi:beta-galactosidase
MKLTFDEKSFVLDGERRFLSCGEIHYARAPRAEWAGILDRSMECGINTVATYVFWNNHEPERDVYDFSGDRDLGHFLDLCAERGLNVLLRVGPYCCAEWNYGGYPPYLRDEPGIRIRTFNKPYLRRVEKYFEHLASEVRPRLATRGGCIVLVQVENEYDNVAGRYGEEGQKYLLWLGELADRLGFDVPRTMCEAASSEKGASVEGAIATVNGFSISAGRAGSFRRAHPGLPMLWTELWPGWYDTWGFQNHFRDPVNIARFILEFVAHGGCGWNYYMWYAGTNFGRTSMYLQTTNYGFGAPLDEHGRITPEARFLGELHHVLRRNEAVLLGGERHQSGARTTWRLGKQSLTLDLEQTRAVLRDGGGRVFFDTGAPRHKARQTPPSGWRKLAALENWELWPEPRPDTRVDEPVKSRDPVEQLQLTRDASDYCWYAARFEVKSAGPVTLEIPYGGDFFRVYLDGKHVATTELPLRECRGSTIPEVASGETIVQGVAVAPAGSGPGYSSRFVFRAGAGLHRLEILAESLGLIKGDWMVSASMETERKGIWAGVKLNGKPLRNWSMFPQLAGEQLGIPRCPAVVAWKTQRQPVALAWHRAWFAIPTRLLRADADFRIDADGLGKGMLFVNGHALGRHWLIEARGFGADENWVEAGKHALTLGPAGGPTQRYYRVPACWLRERNALVIFEEEACSPCLVRIECRRASKKLHIPPFFS